MSKPSIPQGTRDFGADVVRKRNYIFNTIREVFELYGFQPLETPAMENLETLMGKYGEEGDKLIFRILESGNSFNEDFIKSYLDIIVGLANAIYHKKILVDIVKKNENLNDLENEWDKKLWQLSPEKIASVFKEIFEDKEKQKIYLPNYNTSDLPRLKNEVATKALRYDLTIPFARYVAMNHGQLTFPYKRYQMQPVWRADRPQKGRYREFYQCDADVVGSNSLINEVELANIYAIVFERLGINVEIKINSRRILFALAIAVERLGYTNEGVMHAVDENRKQGLNIIATIITTAIDKLDKIGIDGVKKELIEKGITEIQFSLIFDYLKIKGSNNEKIIALNDLFSSYRGVWSPDEDPYEGIKEINSILKNFETSTFNSNISIDLTLARGLNYYTGIIFEVKANNVSIGSIGGGGRYDDLTGLFGVPNIPGVGISFGVDRIYDVMEELKLFPETIYVGTKVLFFNLGEEESKTSFELMQELRSKNIACELYHEQAKFDKQFKYADKKNIPYAVIIGNKEMEEKTCNIKNLKTGEQQTLSQEELAHFHF